MNDMNPGYIILGIIMLAFIAWEIYGIVTIWMEVMP